MLILIFSPALTRPSLGRLIGQSPGCTARIVKYMAKRPAKNISSLDSQTMVPTLTMLGRVSEWTLLDSKLAVAAVDVTTALCPACGLGRTRGHPGDEIVIVASQRPFRH